MPSDTITVSPPNLDRTGFLTLEKGLGGFGPPVRRDWLMARFSDGFQVRMLRAPARGFIEFAPGRASWHAVEGAEHCVVVQCLRHDPACGPENAPEILMRAAEEWARYFGFTAVLALSGDYPCMVPDLAQLGSGYVEMDRTESGVRLIGKVLQGPMKLPRLPQTWALRARELGRGLVIQTAAISEAQDTLAAGLMARARDRGLPARIVRLESAQHARESKVSPGGLFSVLLNGVVIGDDRSSEFQLWQEIRQRLGGERLH